MILIIWSVVLLSVLNLIMPKKVVKENKLKLEDYKALKATLPNMPFDRKIKELTQSKNKNIEHIFVKKKSK